MKHLILFFILLNSVLAAASAEETPHTVEIITVSDDAISPVSFFNPDDAGVYTAAFKNYFPAAKISENSVYVPEESFGSFNLVIDDEGLEKGVYFDKLIISRDGNVVQEIPVIIGFESKRFELKYDVSIDFNQESDISVISGELVISPMIKIYKLDFNNRASDSVVLEYSVYSLDGDRLSYSEEVASVSRQALFEHFFNLGSDYPSEIIIAVYAKRENSFGLDILQISTPISLLFSPPENDYSSMIYISVFIFLLSSMILVSYLWYHKSLSQAKNWKSQINYIKKTQFSDAAIGLRKLQAQRDVLQRAYASKYIPKGSFNSAIAEIDRLSDQLKKRL